MYSFLLCRVVGNELPPKDRVGEKIQSLRFAIEQDRKLGLRGLWLLNRIVDPKYAQQVKETLEGEETLEMPFDPRKFKESENKIQYLTNINPARNYLISEGAKRADFVVSLDQDCFFSAEVWNPVVEFIQQNDSKYYGLISKRLTSLINIWGEPDNEPMIVFRKDSELRFDETLTFGQEDKIELLKRLGYQTKWKCSGDICKTCGYVLHIGYNELLEKNVNTRVTARRQGLNNLLRKANKACGAKIL